jgi:hypothetical protein
LLQQNTPKLPENIFSGETGVMNAVILRTVASISRPDERTKMYDALWRGTTSSIPGEWEIDLETASIITEHLNNPTIRTSVKSIIPEKYLEDGIVRPGEVTDYFQNFLRLSGSSLADKIAHYIANKIVEDAYQLQEFVESIACACCSKCSGILPDGFVEKISGVAKKINDFANQINWSKGINSIIKIVGVAVSFAE